MILAALLAILTCDTMKASLIQYPDWCDRGVLSEEIPGSVPYESASKRLTTATATACLATYGAELQRCFLPQLFEHGWGKQITSGSDLAGFDFLLDYLWEKPSGLELLWWSDNLAAYATNRDFSALSPRLLADFPKLYDERMLNPTNFILVDFMGSPSGQFYYQWWDNDWFDPRVRHQSLTFNQWCVDRMDKIADFKAGFLRPMSAFTNDLRTAQSGRLSTHEKPFSNWNLFYDSGIDSYLHSGWGSLRDMPNHYDYGITPWGRYRHIPTNKLSTVFNKYGCNDFTSTINRKSARVWWDRYALLNALSAVRACTIWDRYYGRCKSYDIDYCTGQTLRVWDFFPYDFRFRAKHHIGTVHGEKSYSIGGGEGLIFALHHNPTNRTASLRIRHDEMKEGEVISTNNIHSVTQEVSSAVSAWADRNPNAVSSISGHVTFQYGDFSKINNPDIPTDISNRVYTLWFFCRAQTFSGGLGYSTNFHLGWKDDQHVFHPLMTAYNNTTNWAVTARAVYDATTEGFQILHGFPERATNLQDNCKMLFDEEIIKTRAVVSIDTVAICTNNSVVGSASRGGINAMSLLRTPKTEYDGFSDIPTRVKDSWLVARAQNTKDNIRGFGEIKTVWGGYLNGIADDMEDAFGVADSYCDAEDGEREPPDFAGHGHPFPNFDEMANVSDDCLDNAFADTEYKIDLIQGVGDTLVNETGLIANFGDNDFTVSTVSGGEARESFIVASIPLISGMYTNTNTVRQSAAVGIERNPLVVTVWDFPLMHYVDTGLNEENQEGSSAE